MLALPGLRSLLARQQASFLLLQASGFATKEAAKESAKDVIVQKDWKQVTIPEQVKKTLEETTTVGGGQAYPNDIRGVSGLGLGDGIKTHTDKWMVGKGKSPMDWIREAEPILVEGPVVASYGSDDPALGCPVEYINLKGSSKEKPAVCKYTGNRYYSLPHTWNSH